MAVEIEEEDKTTRPTGERNAPPVSDSRIPRAEGEYFGHMPEQMEKGLIVFKQFKNWKFYDQRRRRLNKE